MRVLENLPSSGGYLVAAAKLAICLLLVAANWWFINLRTKKFNDHAEIVHGKNAPFVLIRVSMVLGQTVATLALARATATDALTDLLWLVGGGGGIMVAFHVIRKVLEVALTGRLRGADALRRVSMSGAIIQAAFYIADGLVICGALTGSAPTVAVALVRTGIFTVLGFGTLLLAYWLVGMLYGLRHKAKAEIKAVGENGTKVKDKNVAAAVILGSIIVGLGLILQTAIAGDMSDDATGALSDYVPGIVLFTVYAVIGITILVLLLPVLDRLILSGVTIREMVYENNWRPAIVMAGFVVGTALFIANIPIG